MPVERDECVPLNKWPCMATTRAGMKQQPLSRMLIRHQEKAYVGLVGEKCSLSLCKTPKHRDFSSYIFTRV